MSSLPSSLALALAIVAGAAAPSRADHDHSHAHGGHAGHGSPSGSGDPDGDASGFGASVGVRAAGYDARLYTGDYQGASVGAQWSRGRYAAAASLGYYRLQKNGKRVHGVGDAMVHGVAALWTERAVAAGVALGLSLPTGDDRAGFGMGHAMVMPSLWTRWTIGRFAVGGAAGYCRGIGGGSLHAEHGGGAWPLVDPMNFEELTGGVFGELELAGGLRAGASIGGALALDGGDHRAIAGPRIAWTTGRFTTTAELSAGLAGDPFTFRGSIDTAVRF